MTDARTQFDRTRATTARIVVACRASRRWCTRRCGSSNGRSWRRLCTPSPRSPAAFSPALRSAAAYSRGRADRSRRPLRLFAALEAETGLLGSRSRPCWARGRPLVAIETSRLFSLGPCCRRDSLPAVDGWPLRALVRALAPSAKGVGRASGDSTRSTPPERSREHWPRRFLLIRCSACRAPRWLQRC